MLSSRILPHGSIAALLLGLAILTQHASPAQAADPRLTSIDPQGGQRGTEVTVVMSGNRLADAQELVFDEPGLELLEIKPRNANSFEARLKIAPDSRLGYHGVWVRTADGMSEVFTFHVGALPEISEVEPNNDFDNPQKIELGTVVNGVIENEDVDYFVVEAKKGQRISIEIEALRLGRTFFDPYIAILDTQRFELISSDDSALLRQDGLCTLIAPADGQYIIEVRESAYQGNGNCKYRLHVGSFPRPTAVYPAGGKPGETLEVRWLGDAQGERTEQVTLPEQPTREFGLFAQDEHGIAPSANPFRLNDLTNSLEIEPNDEQKDATSGTVPGALNGIIQTPGDVDWFKVGLKKGQQYDIHVHARSLRTPLDPVLSIHNSQGNRLAQNDDNAGSPDAYLRFNAPEDGEFYLSVTDHLSDGGDDFVYRIEIVPVGPELKLSAAEFGQFISAIPEVARGNRTAVLISAQRVNFGGDLQFSIPDLPPGVTMSTIDFTGNRGTVPVVLSAAADAPLKGTMITPSARPKDEQPAITGRFEQQHWRVRGQNNRNVWSYYSDQMALGVVDTMPYEIDVIVPKVPLVQGGSLNLKVVAKRAEGFDEPIAVQLLENPPGVSSSGAITIEKGKNEAEIPITAAGNAPPDMAQLVVIGMANVAGGQARVSTEIFPLEVATPYFAFATQKAAAEQGQDVTLVIEVEQKKEFDGAAKVELLGLPAGVTTEPQELNKEMAELHFPLKVAADARVGKHTSLVCRAVVTLNGEPITHTLGNGELRIDAPLPPKTETKPAEQPQPQPAAVAKKEEAKPLSRLEKLRLERQQAGQ